MTPTEKLDTAMALVREVTQARAVLDIDDTNHLLLEAFRALRIARSNVAEETPTPEVKP